MLRTTPETILRHTVPGSRLIECGLVGYEENPMPAELPFTVSRRLIAGCNLPNVDSEALLARLVGKPCRAALAWDEYDHIGRDRDFAAALLAGAVARRERGINVLIYGPPGTGKTEFCKTVAARLGLRLHAIADDDGLGGEPSRSERVAQIRLSESALAGDGSAVLLFDEMEDLLSPDCGSPVGPGRAGMGGSKAFLNRMLEQNRVPVFWTCNRIDGFDPALLRRMSFAIEIKSPHAAACERILAKTLAREGVAVAPDEVRRIAREFAPAPAIAASAAKAARLGGGGIENVRLAMRAVQKAVRGGAEPPPLPVAEAAYGPRLVAADLDLATLAGRLCRPGAARNFSLCLYGPPGTGKSAFARHLAERLGLEVIHKRASDLISCWVGESEKNIARAFAEARDAGAFLIFDEADSFLQDRAYAARTWEVRQVNEMLTWMECHDWPFACTTNLMELVDPAALRRFTFKVRFGYLGPVQVAEAFRLFFGREAPQAALCLPVLTPGDFAVVAREARILGSEDDPDALAGMLARECAAKPDRPRTVGFAL
ncbi:MAG: AAA family ATPase [Alphaproteobacteria bacterium]